MSTIKAAAHLSFTDMYFLLLSKVSSVAIIAQLVFPSFLPSLSLSFSLSFSFEMKEGLFSFGIFFS